MDKIKLSEPAIVEPVKDPKVIADHTAVAAPNTTAEEDRRTQGQRNVNLIWELTQAVISIGITAAVIYASLTGKTSETLTSAFVLVVSMYLVRTNHSRTGGVGGDSVSGTR